MKGYEKVAEMLFAHNEFDSFSATEIVAVLSAADDQYYNGSNGSFITDEQYDALRLYAGQAYPHHVYFTGVGSEVRGGKIKLPIPLGSLNQVEIGEIADWVGDWMLQEQYLVITDKLDGISALLIYDENGNFQIAYSRGNGTEGADISRHVLNMPAVPQQINGASHAIRGEIIISKQNWPLVQQTVQTKGGTQYKNARNCVAGLMNAKEIDNKVYPLLSFVAYEILA